MTAPRDEPTALTAALTAGNTGADASENVGAGALLRRARDILVEAGEPLPAVELATAVFGVASGPLAGMGGPWVAMLERLLTPSPLFARDASGLWRLTAWDVARRGLLDIEFVAVDVETTGLAPGRHRLIEVGAVIITGGVPGTSFRRLINPERRIPQFITKFTGVTDSMVARSARGSCSRGSTPRRPSWDPNSLQE